LYWLAMLIVAFGFVSEPGRQTLIEPGWHGAAIWLGIPITKAPMLWFVTAIIQCYWLAPLLYLAARRFGWARFAMAAVSLLIAALGISYLYYLHKFGSLGLPEMGAPQVLFYKGFFLGHVLLFALGMLLVPLLSARASLFQGRTILIVSAMAFAVSIYCIRFPDTVFPHSELYLSPMFLLGSVLFCCCMIANSPWVPFQGGLTSLGRHS